MKFTLRLLKITNLDIVLCKTFYLNHIGENSPPTLQANFIFEFRIHFENYNIGDIFVFLGENIYSVRIGSRHFS